VNKVFLADVINWVGVAVGVLGAVIVAPSGFSELVQQVVAIVRRFFPSKPKHITGSGTATLGSLRARGYGYVGMPSGLSDHELLNHLAQRVESLSKTLLEVQRQSDDRHDELRREISRIEAGGQRSEAEIRKLIHDTERQNARFNARGLPLIALGTVMTGPAGILAECTPVGWIFVALGVCSMVYGVWPWHAQLLNRAIRRTAEVS
jgi:hypothetical protein